MIAVPGSVVRTGLLALVAVLLQVSGLTHVHVLGASPDLVPLVVAAVALYGGAVAGCGMGFGTGLLLDLLTGQHLGASALILTAVGYWVGRYGETVDPAHGLTPVAVGSSATAGWVAGTAVVSFMLGIEASVSLLALQHMLVPILLNALLALPVFALARRVLGPVLLRDPVGRRRRRRPQPTTGPLGIRGLGA